MKFYILLLFLWSSLRLAACDICGCAPGTAYLGVLPQFDQNIAGLRFSYNRLVHPSSNYNTYDLDSRVLEDRFYTSEAWLRFYPLKRLQVFTFVPYRVNQRLETNRLTTIRGLGDIRVEAAYTLLDFGDSIQSDWKHLLLVGGGVSLPTGKYQQRDDTRLMLPAAFQLGSGSTDYLLSARYTLRWRTWGINATAQHWFRGANELTYHYGDRSSVSTALFYWGETKRFSYLPALGLSADWLEKDTQYGELKPATGGALVQLTGGLDVYLGRFLLNSFVQLPIYQDIPAEQAGSSLSAGLGVSLFF
jgi:hypothetical protein